MGEIAIFLQALGIFLQIPVAVRAIDKIVKRDDDKLGKKEIEDIRKEVENLKDFLNGSSKLRDEINTWKTIHDAFATYIDGIQVVGVLISGLDTENLQVKNIKKTWNDIRIKKVNMELDTKARSTLN